MDQHNEQGGTWPEVGSTTYKGSLKDSCGFCLLGFNGRHGTKFCPKCGAGVRKMTVVATGGGRVILRQAPHKTRWNAAPLTWWPVSTSGGKTAIIVCANGHSSSIFNHEIHADGTVTPSMVCCPKDGCIWHVRARLEGWES